MISFHYSSVATMVVVTVAVVVVSCYHQCTVGAFQGQQGLCSSTNNKVWSTMKRGSNDVVKQSEGIRYRRTTSGGGAGNNKPIVQFMTPTDDTTTNRFDFGGMMKKVQDATQSAVTATTAATGTSSSTTEKTNGVDKGTTSTISSTTMTENSNAIPSFLDTSAIVQRVEDIDFTTITKNLLIAKDNTMSGELGQRGEIYFLVQLLLVGFVVVGGIPIVGNSLINIVCGPILLLLGVVVGGFSVVDLGSSLSPWPVPPDTGDDDGLKADGIYQYVRHPMYAGLLATCAGFSVITDSVTLLLLSGLLFIVLEYKSTYEEQALTSKYGAKYTQYQKDVTGKFFPNEFIEDLPLPWRK